ncbi:thioredoxin domain-containing protein 5 [Fistulifera solaris]|uniref:Thioredoxin domain-containing protein 5 n=1 Tax=Fistulifera solaris TaxID=1519565 RepID=A0A1Z5K8X4_FISSO|nr:thioredoxin domain-containing protein 5 [Fistulifera solaris]|eukprot:GAX22733.1 thioredoxin domain-containing protein 5 [Fistulifera solaris]
MKWTIATFLGAAAVAQAIELTPENFDAETAGKTVFIKYFAPWCGHCKKLKPDWDKLMEEFNSNPTQLIADVDCTAEGKPLCDAVGVRGYPTLKWGDPSALEDYQGGRDYETLKAFAEKNLKPVCSPANIDLCDADKKAQIEKLLAMPDAELEKSIQENVDAMKKIEDEFNEFVQGLQKQYQDATTKKEADLAAIKDSGFGLMKAVKAHKAKGAKDEL